MEVHVRLDDAVEHETRWPRTKHILTRDVRDGINAQETHGSRLERPVSAQQGIVP